MIATAFNSSGAINDASVTDTSTAIGWFNPGLGSDHVRWNGDHGVARTNLANAREYPECGPRGQARRVQRGTAEFVDNPAAEIWLEPWTAILLL